MTQREQDLVDEVIQRHNALKLIRQPHEALWEDITNLVLPRVSDIIEDTSDTTWLQRVADNYSATGRNVLRLWANGMQGYMTPRDNVWNYVTSANADVLKMRNVRKYFEEVTEALHAHWRRSNFYDALGPVYEHGCAVATSHVTVDWDEARRMVVYLPRHPKQVWIAENYFGVVDTVFIFEELSWRQVAAQFGEERLEVSDRNAVERSPYERVKVLHAVFPRSDKTKAKPGGEAKQKPIASIWILLGRNILLRESGFDTMREVTWRFRRGVGSAYGTGPSHDALVDLLRAEKINQTMLRAADLSVLPPLMYPAELKGRLKINPMGMTPYYDPNRKVTPMYTVGSYPYGIDMLERIDSEIKQHYHIDFWLMLSQSQQRQRTAYEVAQMAGEKVAVMGAEIGRVESELLDPLTDVTLSILNRKGQLPDLPEELIEMDPADIHYSYDGPLAQMQKRHYGQQNVIQMLSQVTLVAQVFPQSLDWIDDDQLMQHALDALDAPEDVLREEKLVEQIRANRAQMQQQQMQMEQAERAAKIQADLAKANPTAAPMGAL